MADTHDADAARATELAGRRIAAGLTGLVLGILLAVLVAYAVWQALGGLRGAAPPPPMPHRLESAPQPSRQAYFAEKQQWLESYGWVDRAHGIARMPVEAAMREMASSVSSVSSASSAASAASATSATSAAEAPAASAGPEPGSKLRSPDSSRAAVVPAQAGTQRLAGEPRQGKTLAPRLRGGDHELSDTRPVTQVTPAPATAPSPHQGGRP